MRTPETQWPDQGIPLPRWGDPTSQPQTSCPAHAGAAAPLGAQALVRAPAPRRERTGGEVDRAEAADFLEQFHAENPQAGPASVAGLLHAYPSLAASWRSSGDFFGFERLGT